MQENNLNLEQSLTQNKGVQTDIWSAFRYADDDVSALNPFALDPEEEARRHRIAQHKASPRSGHILSLIHI